MPKRPWELCSCCSCSMGPEQLINCKLFRLNAGDNIWLEHRCEVRCNCNSPSGNLSGSIRWLKRKRRSQAQNNQGNHCVWRAWIVSHGHDFCFRWEWVMKCGERQTFEECRGIDGNRKQLSWSIVWSAFPSVSAQPAVVLVLRPSIATVWSGEWLTLARCHWYPDVNFSWRSSPLPVPNHGLRQVEDQ